MTSVARSVLGLSILLSATVACSSGSTNSGTSGTGGTGGGLVVPTGGASTGGAATGGATSGGAPGTGGAAPTGVPLTMAAGWVDAATNTLGIQGAVFDYADDTTKAGPPAMAFATEAAGETGKYCISGTAAMVDLMCGADDCYGEMWGAAIGLNLNQPIDPVTEMGVDPPLAFNATALTGFSFDLTGTTVPTTLRFKIDMGGTEEWCTGSETALLSGTNTVTFDKLFQQCWQPAAMRGAGVDAAVKAGIVKISWQVVTNTTGAIPFDFCVSNVVALQ